MAKDDYHVLVNTILKHLYGRLKCGEKVVVDEISHTALGIPKTYWDYILWHMYEDGLIENVQENLYWGKRTLNITSDTTISPYGIDQLEY